MSAKSFNEVQEELKDISLKDMNKQNIYERYILYGTVAELNNPAVMDKIIRYDLLEFIIRKLDIITVNKQHIQEMLNSKCFQDNYSIKSGRIEKVEKVPDISIPNDCERLIITIRDADNNLIQMKYIYAEEEHEKHLIKIGNNIKAIVQKSGNELYLLSFLKEI